MKTSNIILTAVFLSILIWIFVAFITTKAKMAEVMEQNPTEFNLENGEIEKSMKLENFTGISIEGTGNLGITQSSENKLIHYDEGNCNTKIKNGILYISLTKKKRGVNLKVKNLNKIFLKEDVKVNLYDLKSDSLVAKVTSRAEINIRSLTVNYLKLKTENNSEAHLRNINKTVAEAEFEIKDKSIVTINNTKGMSISVKKDADAKYKDN